MTNTVAGIKAVPRSIALATVLAVLFLTFLDTTIVSASLGNIQFDLGAGVIPLQWVVNGYAVVFASLMLIAGSLSDRFGRKPVMLIGIAIFCGGSVACALAPSVGWLIAGRAVMGVGAAACEPGTLSIIRHLYEDPRQRARAIGAWAAVSGLALAMGPVIGGILVGLDGWRAIFWFNLALGGALLVGAAIWVPNSADPQQGRLDYGGFVLGSGFLGSLIYAGISGEQVGYGTDWIITLFAVSGSCLAAFIAVELRVKNPMLNLGYLKKPMVGGALFVAFAVYFGIFSIFFFTALYMNVVIGYSGWQMAGLFGPMAATIVIGSIVAGFWVARAGPRRPMLVGCVVSAFGLLVTRTVLGADPQFAELTITLAVAGAGFGVAVVPLTAAVLGHVPAAFSGMAAGATNTARQLGAVIGVAALGGLVNAHLTSDFGNSLAKQGIGGAGRDFILTMLQTGGKDAAGFDIAHPPAALKPIVDAATAAFRTGLHAALLASSGLILAGAVIALMMPRAALEQFESAATDGPAAAGAPAAGTAPDRPAGARPAGARPAGAGAAGPTSAHPRPEPDNASATSPAAADVRKRRPRP